MRVDVITIFPAMFPPVLGEGMVRIAQEKGVLTVKVWDLRDYSPDRKHRKVDDRPYGGGPGMVMTPEPLVRAVEAVQADGPRAGRLVLLTPQGRRLDQAYVADLAGTERLVFICGRYEGIDERVAQLLRPEELSIGDYVLSGGEVAAMVVVEAVTRLLPGVLGDPGSAADESFTRGGLEYPQYTRPPEFRGLAVPEVLLSGDHEAVRRWREEQARARTESRRADLLGGG